VAGNSADGRWTGLQPLTTRTTTTTFSTYAVDGAHPLDVLQFTATTTPLPHTTLYPLRLRTVALRPGCDSHLLPAPRVPHAVWLFNHPRHLQRDGLPYRHCAFRTRTTRRRHFMPFTATLFVDHRIPCSGWFVGRPFNGGLPCVGYPALNQPATGADTGGYGLPALVVGRFVWTVSWNVGLWTFACR